jgi:RimJ/RimL family protein N-acetyltransferase
VDVPPGKTPDDKLVLGIRTGNRRLVGVIDLLLDYPLTGIWFIGLMLLDPDWCGQRLGAQAVDQLAAWAYRHGAQRLRLGVVGDNWRGQRFWQRMGFVEIERRPPCVFGQKEQVVIVMQLTLAGEPAP